MPQLKVWEHGPSVELKHTGKGESPVHQEGLRLRRMDHVLGFNHLLKGFASMGYYTVALLTSPPTPPIVPYPNLPAKSGTTTTLEGTATVTAKQGV